MALPEINQTLPASPLDAVALITVKFADMGDQSITCAPGVVDADGLTRTEIVESMLDDAKAAILDAISRYEQDND